MGQGGLGELGWVGVGREGVLEGKMVKDRVG